MTGEYGCFSFFELHRRKLRRHPRATASPLSREVLALLQGEPRRMAAHLVRVAILRDAAPVRGPQDDGGVWGCAVTCPTLFIGASRRPQNRGLPARPVQR